jgi:hypothetical protein
MQRTAGNDHEQPQDSFPLSRCLPHHHLHIYSQEQHQVRPGGIARAATVQRAEMGLPVGGYISVLFYGLWDAG